jgi:hypothetical protein
MANNTLLASDSFVSGSLAAGWTVLSGQTETTITGSPYISEPGAADGNTYGQYWSGLSWPNDHVSEITVSALTAESNTNIALWLRTQVGAFSGYAVSITNNKVQVYKCVSGSFTQLGSDATGHTFAAGDVFSAQIAGQVITVYQNGSFVFRWADGTFASGSPGFSQSSSVNLAHSKVGAWRGYSAVQQDGIWQKQGALVGIQSSSDFTAGAGGQANMSMLYEGNAQLLSGNVYKMWFSSGVNAAETNCNYAESTDGINWTRKSGSIISGQGSPFIIKNGSTYYLYTQPNGSQGAGAFNQYTSTDGVTWSLAHSNVFTLGTSGQWDDTIMWYFQPFTIIGGTWYALYSAGHNATTYQLKLGLATSSDGVTWTRSASNPVLSLASGGSIVNGGAIAEVNGTWYFWFFSNQPNLDGSTYPGLDPGESVRYSTTDFIHWTGPVHSVHQSQMYEGMNFSNGQSYVNGIFTVGGNTYLYIQSAPSDGIVDGPDQYFLTMATTGVPISSVVTQNEDAMPVLGTDAFSGGSGGSQVIDNFIRGSYPENPISNGGVWTEELVTPLEVASAGTLEGTSTSAASAAGYVGTAFSANQFSQMTIKALSGTGFVGLYVRGANGAFATTSYQANIRSTGSPAVYKNVAGVQTQLFTLPAAAVGDIWTLTAVGTTISCYQNGVLVGSATNAQISSGIPGVFLFDSTANADTTTSQWVGGNAVDNGASLSSNWTTISGMGALEILSGALVQSTVTGLAGAAYTGTTFGNNQWAEITLSTLATNNSIYPAVRVQSNGACYVFTVNGPLGSSNSTGYFGRLSSSGVLTKIGAPLTWTPSAGDKVRLSVIQGSDGSPVLQAFQNGFLVWTMQDYTNTIGSGGNPGVVFQAPAGGNAQISGFSAGNSAVIPTYVTGTYSITGRVYGTQTYSNGVILSTPKTFGIKVTWTPSPSHFGNLITLPKTFGNQVQWSPAANHFGAKRPGTGVTVTLSGTGSGSTTTDEFGDYSFTGLAAGTYTVTPSQAGYTFDPISTTFTITDSVNAIDFASN